MVEAQLALSALCEIHRIPVTRRLVGRYMTALSGYPETAVVSAIMRAGRECRRMPSPEDLLKRLPLGATPPPLHDLPDDLPAPTAADKAAVRRLADDYLARASGVRK
jgi:hypothetical protein